MRQRTGAASMLLVVQKVRGRGPATERFYVIPRNEHHHEATTLSRASAYSQAQQAFCSRKPDESYELGCILGDPFLGRPSTFRRDSLLRLLMTVGMTKRRSMLAPRYLR